MRGRREGQTSTEYMLTISVIVIAVTAAAYFYVPSFQNGVLQLAQDTSRILQTGQIGGIGLARSGPGIGSTTNGTVGTTGNTGTANPGFGNAGPLGPVPGTRSN